MSIKILRVISSAREWAVESGYEFTEIDLAFDLCKSNPATGFKYLSPNLQSALDLENSEYYSNPIRIRAKGLYVLVWNWETNGSRLNYKYFIISSSGNLFCEPPGHSEIWLKYFPSLFYRQDGIIGIDERIISQAENVVPERNMLVIGGSWHFGHWIADSLPQIVQSFAEKDSFELLVTEFSPYQTSAVKHLFREIYRKNLLNVLQVNIGRSPLKVYKFSEAYIYGDFSVRAKNLLLRLAVGSDTIDNQGLYKALPHWKHSVYLFRGRVNGVERIANECRLVKIFQDEGISTVDSATLSFDQAKLLFSKYRYFITCLSSGNTNFNVFGEPNSYLVQLLPVSFQRLKSEVALGSAIYMTPRIENTNFLYCDQSDPDSEDEHAQIMLRDVIIDEIIRRLRLG